MKDFVRKRNFLLLAKLILWFVGIWGRGGAKVFWCALELRAYHVTCFLLWFAMGNLLQWNWAAKNSKIKNLRANFRWRRKLSIGWSMEVAIGSRWVSQAHFVMAETFNYVEMKKSGFEGQRVVVWLRVQRQLSPRSGRVLELKFQLLFLLQLHLQLFF